MRHSFVGLGMGRRALRWRMMAPFRRRGGGFVELLYMIDKLIVHSAAPPMLPCLWSMTPAPRPASRSLLLPHQQLAYSQGTHTYGMVYGVPC